jgi:hypothetical protein
MVDAIERRYSFSLPPAYRLLVERGHLDPQYIDRQNILQSRYLYLFDAEWWQPAEIAAYQPPAHHLPGFVPFASTGGGDYWCWWPARASNRNVPVVLCPHDLNTGTFDAPDFAAWLFRRTLDYALRLPDGEEQGRAWLARWAEVFRELWESAWSSELVRIAGAPVSSWVDVRTSEPGEGLLAPETYRQLLEQHTPMPERDQEFRWMR